MSNKDKDQVPCGEYILYIALAAFIGLGLGGIVTQFVIKLITGAQISFIQAIGINLVIGLIIWAISSLLRRKP